MNSLPFHYGRVAAALVSGALFLMRTGTLAKQTSAEPSSYAVLTEQSATFYEMTDLETLAQHRTCYGNFLLMRRGRTPLPQEFSAHLEREYRKGERVKGSTKISPSKFLVIAIFDANNKPLFALSLFEENIITVVEIIEVLPQIYQYKKGDVWDGSFQSAGFAKHLNDLITTSPTQK